MIRRGGPQFIPRPAGFRAGRLAPWADIPEAERRIDVHALRAAFAGRGPGRASEAEARGVRASAVLAPFYEHEGDPYLLFTRRSWDLRAHKGEVSFPGGAVDPGETPVEAALREGKEEIDLDPSLVEIVGELDHLATISSASFIVPFVGLLPGRPEGLSPNPREVDAVLHVPLAELLLDEVYREEVWDFAGEPRALFFFELIGDTLWGATAAILRQLLSWCLGLPVDLEHG